MLLPNLEIKLSTFCAVSPNVASSSLISIVMGSVLSTIEMCSLLEFRQLGLFRRFTHTASDGANVSTYLSYALSSATT